MRIQQDGGVTRVLLNESGQRINVGDRAQKEPVLIYRCVELDGFEEFAGPCGCKQRQAVRGSVDLVCQVLVDTIDVTLETRPLGRRVLECLQMLREGLA